MIGGKQAAIDLGFELKPWFEKITNDRKKYERIEESLAQEHGIQRTRTSAVFMNRLPIVSLLTEELYLITRSIYNEAEGILGLNKEKIKPEKYFLPDEMYKGDNYKEIRQVEKEKTIRFENVINMSNALYKLYVCVVPVSKLVKIDASGYFKYEPMTQRQAFKRIIDGKIQSQPTILLDKIKDIKESLKANKPNQNFIAINIPDIGGEKVVYNEDKENDLKITMDEVTTRCNIIDGYHRFCAITELAMEDSDYMTDGLVTLFIYNMDNDLARLYIANVNAQTKIEDYVVEVYKNDNPYMDMAKYINSYGSKDNNELYMRICDDLYDVENSTDFYTTFQILSRAIEHNFDPNKTLDNLARNKMRKFIIEGFVWIIGTYRNSFDDISKSREHSVVTLPNTFIGFVAILAKLYENYRDTWEDKIEDILNDIIYDKEAHSKEWNKMGLYVSNINTTHVEKISNYFKQFVK